MAARFIAAAAAWGAHGRACLYGNKTSCSLAWDPSVEASADRRRPDVDAAAAISVSRDGVDPDYRQFSNPISCISIPRSGTGSASAVRPCSAPRFACGS
ncbi:unnamed protein product [Urochloa humidicola]